MGGLAQLCRAHAGEGADALKVWKDRPEEETAPERVDTCEEPSGRRLLGRSAGRGCAQSHGLPFTWTQTTVPRASRAAATCVS